VGTRDHWQHVYATRAPEEVSWHEQSPQTSLELIDASGVAGDAPIIDVGGGSSRLAGELLRRGYSDVTVADVSGTALERARGELGEGATRVTWVEADVRDHDFGRSFELLHDRALLHFMVEEHDRAGYLATLRRSLAAGGHLIIATFGPDGPTQCSGLPVRRYGAEAVSKLLGPEFELLSTRLREHTTPSGRSQQFHYAHLRRNGKLSG
jgi:SAM-dependent methyltransferase